LSISVIEAGRKGGLSLLHKRGIEYFSSIGRKGQQAMRRRFPGKAQEWGRKGGRPRKHSLVDNMGEVGKKK
jgi:hypothetical protein